MKRRARSWRTLGVGALVGFAIQGAAFGWATSGHRIVAQVGEDHLSESVRAKVLEITGGRSLAQIATWPDFIRSEASWNCAQPWHFLTFEDWETIDEALARKATFRDCKLPSEENLPAGAKLPHNVVQAIDFFSDLLAGDGQKRAVFEELAKQNKAEFLAGSVELSALSFLVHLVGDVHQPLHVGRGNDRGGNMVSVNWFGEVSNLHTSWDQGLIESENLSYTEFVAFLEAEEGGNADLGNLTDTKAWAQDSRSARFKVYEIYAKTDRQNHLPDLSYEYAHDQMEVLNRSLYRGGRRLAVRLSSIFSSP